MKRIISKVVAASLMMTMLCCSFSLLVANAASVDREIAANTANCEMNTNSDDLLILAQWLTKSIKQWPVLA